MGWLGVEMGGDPDLGQGLIFLINFNSIESVSNVKVNNPVVLFKCL